VSATDRALRALTVKQPWAAAIAAGRKTVENRLWPTRYRGPLAIHAGRTLDQVVLDTTAPLDFQHPRVQRAYAAAAPHLRTLGALVALAELADCHPAHGCCAPWGEAEPDAWHWVLTHIRALKRPIPCTGHQRLWRPDPATLTALRAEGRCPCFTPPFPTSASA
jgi:hypothetical protein